MTISSSSTGVHHADPRPWRILLAAVWSLSALVVVWSIILFVRSAVPSDAYIFLAVGRGILNHRIPYMDLFESKPIGIFLLNALSLRLTGGMLLNTLFVIIGFLAIPGLLIGVAWRSTAAQRPITVAAAAAFGISLSVYHLTYAYLPDFYASIVACAFAASFAFPLRRTIRIFVGAVCAFLIFLLREPLLLVYGAIALLLCPKPRDVLDAAAASIIGVAAGLLLIAVLGYWNGYVNMYLPNILTTRLSQTSSFILGFYRVNAAIDLFFFSWAFFLACISLLVVIVHRRAMSFGPLYGIVTLLLSLYCVNVAVNTGTITQSFYAYYAVALYFALFVSWLLTNHSTIRGERAWLTLFPPLFSILALLLAFFQLSLRSHPALIPSEREVSIARRLDAIMDACNVDRYVFLGSSHEIAGLTRHSPMGPLFFFEANFLRDEFLVSSVAENVGKTDLILSEKVMHISVPEPFTHYFKDIQDEMTRSFTNKPWECAQDEIAMEGYELLFRKRIP